MGLIFISHVEEDSSLALALSLALEEEGYSTWLFEIDSILAVPYYEQVITAIERSSAFLLLISRTAMKSRQCDIEVTRAYELGKPFMPLLYGLTHSEFQTVKRGWHHLFGGATSIIIPPEGVPKIIKQLFSGLMALGLPKAALNLEKITELRSRIENNPTLQKRATSSIQFGYDGPTDDVDSNRSNFKDPRITIVVYSESKPQALHFDGRQQSKIFIGRDSTSDIVLPTKTTSRKHAMFVYDKSRGWIIRDLNSKNGTFHMERKIQEVELRLFDEIEIGGVRLIVRGDMEEK